MCRHALIWVGLLAGCDIVFDLDDELEKPPDAAVDAVVLACPPTYESFSGGRYRFSTTQVGFRSAEAECKQDGFGFTGHTHLVVADQSELGLVAARSMQLAQGNFPLIGLSNARTIPTFQWVTDEPVAVPANQTPPWGPSEPDNPTTENCVVMDTPSATLRDTSCGITYFFICECDAFAEDPTNF